MICSSFTLLSAIFLLASPASAEEEAVALTISGSVDAINISVANQSGSSDADARELEVISSAHVLGVDGHVNCGSGASASQIELLMGSVDLVWGKDGPSLLEGFIWDTAEPIVYNSSGMKRDFSFAHDLDVPLTFDTEALIVLSGLDPVQVVEEHLETYVANGGSVIDFLRTDDVFETSFDINAVATCDTGVSTSVLLETRSVSAYVFYHGDSAITPQVVGGGTLDVLAPEPAPSPDVLYALEAEPEDVREVAFERFEIYDTDTATYAGVWAGYVSYPSDEVCRVPQMAVTDDGACVQVDGCIPVEFDSCRTIDGCCAGL